MTVCGGRYRPDSVAVYIATNQSKELAQKKLKEQSDEDFLSSILSGADRKGAEEDYELANRSQWVKIPRDSSIGDVLRIQDHVVGGFPVLHVVEENRCLAVCVLGSG